MKYLGTPAHQMVANIPSCVDPTPEDTLEWEKIEADILASSVYIEMKGFVHFGDFRREITKGNMSHATIVGGRYLVTHNHYSYPLTVTADPGEDGYTGITLRKMNGEVLLDAAPLTSFSLVYEDPQTLALDFGDVNKSGFFDALGLRSALTLDWDQVPWAEGLELAQLDWSGETTHVDWVIVEAYQTKIQVPVVQIDNFLMQGASGGGVFWNGYHVGNNWLRNLERNHQTNQVEHTFSTVSLNSAALVEMTS